MRAGHTAPPGQDAVGDYFSRTIKAIGFVTKTFPPALPPPVREIFRAALESAGSVLSGLPAHSEVRAQCIFLLHRMVACLGPNLVPYLPSSLPSLISTTNSQNALETFQLINQFVAKYPLPMNTVMVPLFVPIVQKLFSVMPQQWTPRGSDAKVVPTNAQVLAESLLNVFVLFIQNIVCNNMATTVLLDRQAALPFLPQVLGSLLQACKSVPDPVLVKSVFMIFRSLARTWIEKDDAGGRKRDGRVELGGGCRGKGADPAMAITSSPPPPDEVRTMFAKFLIEEATLTGLNVCVQFGYDPSDAAHTITMHKEFLVAACGGRAPMLRDSLRHVCDREIRWCDARMRPSGMRRIRTPFARRYAASCFRKILCKDGSGAEFGKHKSELVLGQKSKLRFFSLCLKSCRLKMRPTRIRRSYQAYR